MAEQQPGREPSTPDRNGNGGGVKERARKLSGTGSPLMAFLRSIAQAVQKALEILAQAKLALVLVTVVLVLLAVVLLLAVIVLLLQL